MPTKRELRDFPEVYFQIADHFLSSREPLIHDLTLREARSVRQDFYRFVTKVRRECENGDDYAKKLRPAIDDVEVSIKPAKGDEFDMVKIRFLKNALKGGLALRKGLDNQPLTPTEDKAPTSEPEDVIDLTGLEELLG